MPGPFGTDVGRSNEALQDALSAGEPRIVASYSLIGAILLLGGTGYALDRWLHTSPWLLLVGLLGGIVIGFAKLIESVRKP
jgi:F0F1-type ATP synthase assembly protein I